jgi:mono/diheme cytochrome c family protein
VNSRIIVTGALAVLCVFSVGQTVVPQSQAPALNSISNADAATTRAVLDRYCVTCHNEKANVAKLHLEKLDVTHFAKDTELGEKIVRKLRAGMMPPTGLPRPDTTTREAVLTWMEGELDRAAAQHLPAPGLHRLNRTEYANAIRDLLGLKVDASKFLPSDDSTRGFDNMAGTLTVSPALIEAYLAAAGKISRLALNNVTAPTQIVYDGPPDTAQNGHIEGLSFNTRGAMLVEHEFPADGEYIIKALPIAGYFKNVLGGVTGEMLEVTVDGDRVKLFDWDKEIGTGGVGKIGETPKIAIRAGLHSVGFAFLSTNDAPGNELNKPFVRTMNSPGQIPGYLFYPHVGQMQIEGPLQRGRCDRLSEPPKDLCLPSGQSAGRGRLRQTSSQFARAPSVPSSRPT